MSPDDARDLVRHLRAAAEETGSLEDDGFAAAAGDAADRIEVLLDADDDGALAGAVAGAWKALGGFAVTRGILAGSTRAFSPTSGPDPAEPPPLERTPEAVFFLQKLVRDVQRSV